MLAVEKNVGSFLKLFPLFLKLLHLPSEPRQVLPKFIL